MIENFPFVGDMGEDDYHSDAQLPVAALSHGLAYKLLARSPAHARAACRKLNPLAVHKESDTFDRGTAAHAVLLGGEGALVVVDADDWRSKAARESKESARRLGLCPILKRHHDDVRRMADIMRDALFRCPDLAGLDLSAGRCEQSVVWAEGEGPARILLRMRADWWNTERDVIVDYKTTEGSAHPNAWLKTMLSTGADIQDALYRRGNAASGGAEDALFLFAVQENMEPFATSMIALDPGFKAFAEEKTGHAIMSWRDCMMTGNWPAYQRRIAYVQPPAWALTQYAEGGLISEGEGERPGGIAYDPGVLYAGAEG